MSSLTISQTWKAAAILTIAGGLWACSTTTYYVPAGEGRAGGMVRITRSFTDQGLARYTADFDPAMLALAKRHDPRPHTDYWGRVEGWEVINLKDIPRIGDRAPDFDEARLINGLRPMTPDGTPVIGKTKLDNLFLNTGHGTLGWTMACGSARVIADIIDGRAPDIESADLGIARYG